jgi:hypothetical protein
VGSSSLIKRNLLPGTGSSLSEFGIESENLLNSNLQGWPGNLDFVNPPDIPIEGRGTSGSYFHAARTS